MASAVYAADEFREGVPAPVGGLARVVPSAMFIPLAPITLPFADDWAMLASDLPDLNSPTLGPWFTDLLKVLAVIFFLIAGAEKVRALFGRTPPIHVELETMRSQIIPKKKIEADFREVHDTLQRIEGTLQEHGEALAVDTAIRAGNRELLAALSASHTDLNNDFRTLCGTITQFMKEHPGRK